jgi:hypothetical protein
MRLVDLLFSDAIQPSRSSHSDYPLPSCLRF